MRVANAPHRDGINQVDVPGNQRGKGFFGTVFRILPQQYAVIRWLHSAVSVRNLAKTDNLFAAVGRIN
jgi:hypothetical protein